MSNLVEQILKNEIEILKSKYLPEDTGHLRTAVSVLEERIKELPVSDQAYLTMHNIQLEMMKDFAEKIETNTLKNDVWDRKWAIESAIKYLEASKKSDFIILDIIVYADMFYNYINKGK